MTDISLNIFQGVFETGNFFPLVICWGTMEDKLLPGLPKLALRVFEHPRRPVPPEQVFGAAELATANRLCS